MMKLSVSILTLVMVALPSLCQAVVVGPVVAHQGFDSQSNLKSSSFSHPINSFTDSADAWGVYSRATGGPHDLFDATVSDPNNMGIADPSDAIGIAGSSKSDAFFAVADYRNPDTTTDNYFARFVFDISGVTSLTGFSIDIAAMGDFEPSDEFSITAQLGNAVPTALFETSVDEDGEHIYAMEKANTFVTEPDPMTITDVAAVSTSNSVAHVLTNEFTTFTAPLSGSGSELTIEITAPGMNGSDEVVGFDNLTVHGLTAVPEPSAFALLGLVGVAIGGLRFVRKKSS